MIKKILTGLALSASILSATNTAEINVNNNTLGLKGDYAINDIYELSSDAKYSITLSYLSSEDTQGSKNVDRIANIGLKIMNPYINDNGISLGLGINTVWVSNYTKTFFATPLSLFADYSISEELILSSALSYSPKILSFSGAENYQELTAKLNYKVIDNGFVYLGYRNIKTKYEDDITVKFDDTIFVGYKVQF
jgi:hypothetical protein